jgi:hypothetical protein
MPGHSKELPKSGFAIEIDGQLKTKFATKEGAEQGGAGHCPVNTPLAGEAV